MNEENYWQRFTDSGSIQDYLSYSNTRKATDKNKCRQVESEGDNPYAGVCYGNGNGFESDAYR